MAKKKMGRPPKEIDKRMFETLCSMQCTEEEICAVLNVDVNTLIKFCKKEYKNKTFSEVFKEKRQYGKASLRRTQWLAAVEDRNISMLIFLGKNYLGQSDKVENDVKADNAINIKIDVPTESEVNED